MIIKETDPNMVYTRHIQELSEEERVRVQEICDELREIFNADSVSFFGSEPTVSKKTDYFIKIYNADTLGYIS
jgi:hypothetical protein